jgi:hypothetical protein
VKTHSKPRQQILEQFTVIINYDRKTLVFVTVIFFHPSLTFQDKARSQPLAQIHSSLAWKYYTVLESTDIDKHTSLLR